MHPVHSPVSLWKQQKLRECSSEKIVPAWPTIGCQHSLQTPLKSSGDFTPYASLLPDPVPEGCLLIPPSFYTHFVICASSYPWNRLWFLYQDIRKGDAHPCARIFFCSVEEWFSLFSYSMTSHLVLFSVKEPPCFYENLVEPGWNKGNAADPQPCCCHCAAMV